MIILIEDYITRDPGFLYETITESIEKGMRLVLNFRNINKLTEEYIADSIGRVIDENDFEAIKNKVNFINVNQEIKKIIIELVNRK